MKSKFKNWKQEYPDYWVNKISNYVVKEIGKEEGQEWVIIDNEGMMLSCEWRDNKEDCMKEADYIYAEELKAT